MMCKSEKKKNPSANDYFYLSVRPRSGSTVKTNLCFHFAASGCGETDQRPCHGGQQEPVLSV